MALRLPQINRLWILLALAVLLGLGATWLAINYLKGREKRIAEELAQRAKGGPTVAVVVPVRTLPRGTVLDDKAVAAREIASDLVYEETITADQFDKIAGRRLLRPVERGRPLRRADLFDVRSKDFSDQVEEGMRALTIDIDELNSIAQMLRPGNFVDLFLITSDQGGTGQEVLPLLERVKIVATGQTVQDAEVDAPAQGQQKAAFTNVTIEVSADEAARIALAQQSGKIRAVLRNTKDEQSADIGQVNTASLRRGARGGGGPLTVEYFIGGKNAGSGAAAPVNINVPGLNVPGVSIPGLTPGAPPAGLPAGLQALPPSIQNGIPSQSNGFAPPR